MTHSDQRIIAEAYSLILERQALEREIDHHLKLLNEGDISDWFNKTAGKVGDVAQSAYDATAGAASKIAELPANLEKFANASLPEFMDKLGTFASNAGMGVVGGAAGSYVLGKILTIIANKMNSEGDKNREVMMQMLPKIVQQKLEKIESLKDADPKQYAKEMFDASKNSLQQLEKHLKSSGVRFEGSILQRVLFWLGKFLSSSAGAITGAVVIPLLMVKLGFNPMPNFTNADAP